MDLYIAAGLFWGVTEELGLDQLQLCLKDARDGKEYMQEGMESIWRLNSEAIDRGFTQIVNAFDLVPNLGYDCMNASEDWAALDKWADIFFHPFEIIPTARKNISENEERLMELAELAQEQLAAEEFFEFGKTFGRMNAVIVSAVIVA
jgi:hypothetical protein